MIYAIMEDHVRGGTLQAGVNVRVVNVKHVRLLFNPFGIHYLESLYDLFRVLMV